MLYRVARRLLRILFGTIYRLSSEGTHHIPRTGPVILCANHRSNMDPPLLGTPVNRTVHYMAKAELFKVPGLGFLIKRLGAFPVQRGGVSRQAIRLATQLLQENKVMGIFPEGSRAKSADMEMTREGQKGAASLALRSGATVVPVAIIGGYAPFRTKVKIIYGEPVDLSEFAGAAVTSESLGAATEKIMDAIRNLLAAHKVKQD